MNVLPFIDLKSQFLALEPAIRSRIDRVLEHGQYIMGPEVAELEAHLAQYSGAEHCIAVGSGTDALLISLMALDIGPGDEVITSAFSFFATAEVIALTGATPVFVDVDAQTANIDVERIAEKLTEHTRAIMPVSMFGQTADMAAINDLAADLHRVAVIEDAAQSFGAEHHRRKSTHLSDIGCTSFFPSKPLGCYGDGGAIFTDDPVIAQACREIRVHGQVARYEHKRIGVSSRLDTIQAAILLAKFERFPDECLKRYEAGERYNSLMDDKGIGRIQQRAGNRSVHAQYTVLVNKRDSVRSKLSELGIPTAVHYPKALPLQDALAGTCCEECIPSAIALSEQVLSIPMYPTITAEAQEYIARELHASLG